MGVLAEFVRKEAEHLRGEAHQRETALGEWLRAIESLYEQLARWVNDADAGHHLLSVTPSRGHIRQEALLGVYEVPQFAIGFGGQFSLPLAEIVPRARYVMASIKPSGEDPRRADGMVDIKTGGVTSHYLFRRADPGGDRWFIRSVEQWNADTDYGTVDPLDRDRFEAAILSAVR